ncbi:hypothetical protein LEMLEM_LOCUS20134 [Lemmus lemmus]
MSGGHRSACQSQVLSHSVESRSSALAASTTGCKRRLDPGRC